MVFWKCFIFIPIPGEMIQSEYFSNELVQPPIRKKPWPFHWPHSTLPPQALHGVQQLHLDSNRSIRGSERRRSRTGSKLLSIWMIFSLNLCGKLWDLSVGVIFSMFGIFWHSCWFRLIGFTAHDQKCHHSHHYSWVVATQIFLMFTPKIGEMIQFDKYLADGLVPPATRYIGDLWWWTWSASINDFEVLPGVL